MNPHLAHVYFATILRSFEVLVIVVSRHFGHLNRTAPFPSVSVSIACLD